MRAHGVSKLQAGGAALAAAAAMLAPQAAQAAHVAQAARAAGRGWVIGLTPSPPGSFGANLNAVSCQSAAACTAVGDYLVTRSGKTRPMALAWNGAQWTVLSAPGRGSNGVLSGVSCPSASSCTAVGGYVTDTHGDRLALAEHWNGSSWAVQAVPTPAGAASAFLDAVSCPSARSCIAVGGYLDSAKRTAALAEHWNGTRWQVQPTGVSAAILSGVSCSAAAACTAVGVFGSQALAERWDGKHWAVQARAALPAASSSALTAVSCPAAGACTAAGSYTSGSLQILAEHWNGARWVAQSAPLAAGMHGSFRYAVSCPAAASCTLAGNLTDGTGAAVQSLVEHWNGARWAAVPAPSPHGRNIRLSGISCPPTGGCMAVGSYVSHGTVRGFAERKA